MSGACSCSSLVFETLGQAIGQQRCSKPRQTALWELNVIHWMDETRKARACKQLFKMHVAGRVSGRTSLWFDGTRWLWEAHADPRACQLDAAQHESTEEHRSSGRARCKTEKQPVRGPLMSWSLSTEPEPTTSAALMDVGGMEENQEDGTQRS